MVTIQTGLAINTATPGDRTIAQAFRRILASLFLQSAPGTPTPGVIAVDGSTPLDVTGDASAMTYHVSPGFAVTTRTSQGAYVLGSISQVDITGVTVGDGSNPRIDRVYIVQPDPELGESGVARIAHVEGTPAGSPTLPSLPTGALELARFTVPAGAANTNAATKSNPAPLTGLNVVASQIAGLSALLAAKAPLSHTHTASAITDQQNLDAGKVGGLRIYSIVDGDPDPSPLSTGDIVIYRPA